MINEKIVLFGTGGKLKYEKEKHPEIFNQLNIVACLDNNGALHKKVAGEIPILSPEEIC